MDWWILTAKSSRGLLKQRTTAPTSYLSDLHWSVKPFFLELMDVSMQSAGEACEMYLKKHFCSLLALKMQPITYLTGLLLIIICYLLFFDGVVKSYKIAPPEISG